jgi:hypothetical protein
VNENVFFSNLLFQRNFVSAPNPGYSIEPGGIKAKYQSAGGALCSVAISEVEGKVSRAMLWFHRGRGQGSSRSWSV